MHHSGLVLAAMTVLPSLALAANTVKFVNHCEHDFWFWVIYPGPMDRPAHHDPAGIKVPGNGGSTIHAMENTEGLGAGISLKIRDLPKYEHAPAGIMQVEYNMVPSRHHIWYDLSAIDCNINAGPEVAWYCPLLEGGFRLDVDHAPGEHCPPAWCKDRICHNTYTRPGAWTGEPSFVCGVGSDIVVQTCSDGPARRTFDKDTPDPGVPFLGPNTPGLVTISPDQTCGPKAGFTCKDSPWGQCCSQYNYCGTTPEHCDNKCQSAFGNCDAYKFPDTPPSIPSPSTLKTVMAEPTSSPQPLKVSPDGNCGADTGYTCAGSEKGDCCSSYNYCGVSDVYCGAGCQSAFGICPDDNKNNTSLVVEATPAHMTKTDKLDKPTTTSSPSSSPGFGISTDGSCGAKAGFTCSGSSTGRCCSQYNFCGDTSNHCLVECQPEFGDCDKVVKRQNKEQPKSWMGLTAAPHPTRAPEWVDPDNTTKPLDEVMKEWSGN